MVRMLDETAASNFWPCNSKSDNVAPPMPRDAATHESPDFADVYREDPYRFEPEDMPMSIAELAATDDLRRIDYLPTPAEIAGVCAQIRRGWTACEKRRRFVGELPAEALESSAWAPPVVDTSHFRIATHGVGEMA